MPSTTDDSGSLVLQPSADDLRIAWLTALALSLHVIELALPSPIPGVKPGLANVVTVATLVHFGLSAAAWVSLLRVIAGALLLGTLLSPTFILSFSGALASLLILTLAVTASRGRWFGPLGYSVLAALAHMAAQIGTAYIAFVPNRGLFYLLPVLMTAALIFGLLNGIIARQMLLRLPAN